MDTLALPSARCLFDLGNGSICPSTNVIARGYCEKHYRALSRAGAFDNVPAPRVKSGEVLAANVASVKRARKRLLKSTPKIVDAFVEGAIKSAKSGKTNAAQWALLHTRVVEPVAEATNDHSANNRPIINIGVKVSGVKSDSDVDK